MFDNLDPTFLGRVQFAFTVAFHILFPAFTIGLASWLAVLEWRWLRTGNEVYKSGNPSGGAFTLGATTSVRVFSVFQEKDGGQSYELTG